MPIASAQDFEHSMPTATTRAMAQLLFASLIVFSSSCDAAMWTYIDYGQHLPNPKKLEYLTMDGPIEQGDAQRLRNVILANPQRAKHAFGLALNSPGGSVDEAMKIGEIIKVMLWSAAVGFGVDDNAICASACFLIYVAAAKREAMPRRLGIHRIYIRPNSGQQLALDTSRTMRDANQNLRDYLNEMDVQPSIFERMRASSSREVEWLSRDDVQSIGVFAPFWEEYLIANCGYDKRQLMKLYAADSDAEIARIHAEMAEFWSCYNRFMSRERTLGPEKLRGVDMQRKWSRDFIAK